MGRILLVAALLAACAPRAARSGGGAPEVAGASARAAFDDLEARLAGSREVEIRFAARAEGAVEASVSGSMRVAEAEVGLRVRGTFAGQSLDAALLTSRDGMLYQVDGNTSTEARPADPRGALVIGLTRMGVLHNVAMLSQGAGPDRADGTVRDWVQVVDVREAGERDLDGVVAHGYSFGIVVDGEDVGTATLWLAAADGRPLRREQTVKFPDGEMRVVETYEVVRL